MQEAAITLSAGFYAAGYLTGLLAFVLMARKRKLLTRGILTLMLAGLLGGLLGANLAQQMIAGSAGKTVLGALAGGYLTVALAKRIMGITRPLGDLFAVAICAGEAVGRWGCFFGGCCYGRPCALPWAVWQHEAWRHPTQIYLSLASLVILIALLRCERLALPENGIFYLQGVLYCAARFLIEFCRTAPVVELGLSVAQWACIAGAAFFAVRFYRLARQSQDTLADPRLQTASRL